MVHFVDTKTEGRVNSEEPELAAYFDAAVHILLQQKMTLNEI